LADLKMAITKEDIKFLEIIDEMEPKANCLRANIAALIAKDGKILVKHTNDWHPETNCKELGCIRNIQNVKSGTQRETCYGLCAEQWCIALAAKEGISLKGATIYITKHPCRVCESLIAESGITRVVFQEGYPDALPNFNILKEKGIGIEQGPNTDKRNPKRLKADSI
jgi:dCMP deaminase